MILFILINRFQIKLQTIRFELSAMKDQAIKVGHRKDARKNHGERVRDNQSRSDLHNPKGLLLFMYGVLYIDNSDHPAATFFRFFFGVFIILVFKAD